MVSKIAFGSVNVMVAGNGFFKTIENLETRGIFKNKLKEMGCTVTTEDENKETQYFNPQSITKINAPSHLSTKDKDRFDKDLVRSFKLAGLRHAYIIDDNDPFKKEEEPDVIKAFKILDKWC